MKIFIMVLVALLGTSALIALLSPYLLLRAAKLDAGDTMQARRHLVCSSIVIVTAVAASLGLSFAGHAGNIVAVIIALFCGGALALFSFRIKPKLLAVPVGILSVFGWLLMMLFLGGIMVFAGNSPVTAELGHGLHCRATVYGFVTGDSGEDLDVYQRYLFIDHKLYHETRSVIYPNQPITAPVALEDAIHRCDAAVNQRPSNVGQ